MATLQVKQVNKQGQISIGKKYAGKKVEVDEYPDGTVILKPVEVISEFEMKLLKDRVFQNRLKAFDRWEYANKPAETDLATLHLLQDGFRSAQALFRA
jgi:hypothetical protein